MEGREETQASCLRLGSAGAGRRGSADVERRGRIVRFGDGGDEGDDGTHASARLPHCCLPYCVLKSLLRLIQGGDENNADQFTARQSVQVPVSHSSSSVCKSKDYRATCYVVWSADIQTEFTK
jgi:hypothetical protein